MDKGLPPHVKALLNGLSPLWVCHPGAGRLLQALGSLPIGGGYLVWASGYL